MTVLQLIKKYQEIRGQDFEVISLTQVIQDLITIERDKKIRKIDR